MADWRLGSTGLSTWLGLECRLSRSRWILGRWPLARQWPQWVPLEIGLTRPWEMARRLLDPCDEPTGLPLDFRSLWSQWLLDCRALARE